MRPSVFTSAFGDSTRRDRSRRPNLRGGRRPTFEKAFAAQISPPKAPPRFGPDVYAEYSFVESLQTNLAASQAIPVAVGSGTINDLTKLAAHRLGRPYMVVATAASMDGYTAYGASITYCGVQADVRLPGPSGRRG